jgi:trimeric autotransporter adhesin
MLIRTANANTAVGYLSLSANTTGTFNTALGLCSLRANTTADNNTAVGKNAMLFATPQAVKTYSSRFTVH